MKKVLLVFCLLLIIPFCFIGCSSREYITEISENVYEFEADKNYNNKYYVQVEIYFTTTASPDIYLKSNGAIYYMFNDGDNNFQYLKQGDKIRFRLSYSGINDFTINKIKIVSNEDESIYYEQVIN